MCVSMGTSKLFIQEYDKGIFRCSIDVVDWKIAVVSKMDVSDNTQNWKLMG